MKSFSFVSPYVSPGMVPGSAPAFAEGTPLPCWPEEFLSGELGPSKLEGPSAADNESLELHATSAANPKGRARKRSEVRVSAIGQRLRNLRSKDELRTSIEICLRIT